MNCKNCDNKLENDAKFCNKCGTAVALMEPKQATSVNAIEKWRTKKVLSSIGAIAVFILAFAGARWLSYEGTSKVIDKYNENKTEQKVVDYFTDTSSWKEFNSPVGKFKATFPSYPAHKTDNIDTGTGLTLKYDTYTGETSDGTSYMVNMVVYPAKVDTSNPETNLEGSLNGMLASNDANKLISSNLTYSNGYRALDFLILNNGTVYLKGKIIMAGQTLYQVMVAYESKNYNESNYSKFMNSFNLQ